MNLVIMLSQTMYEWTWKTSAYATLLIVLVFVLQNLLSKWLTPRLRYAFSLLILIRLLLPTVPSSSLSFENFFPSSARLTKTTSFLPVFAPSTAVATSLQQTDISSVSIPAEGHQQGISVSGA